MNQYDHNQTIEAHDPIPTNRSGAEGSPANQNQPILQRQPGRQHKSGCDIHP